MITIRLIDGTHKLNIYNIYNAPPTSYTDESGIEILSYLLLALSMPREYIVVRDFNLYYPL